MGSPAVSHYTRLEVSTKGVEITYILGLDEVPTYVLLREWKLTAKSPHTELQQKAVEQAEKWAKGLEFRAAGKPVEPQFVHAVFDVGVFVQRARPSACHCIHL